MLRISSKIAAVISPSLSIKNGLYDFTICWSDCSNHYILKEDKKKQIRKMSVFMQRKRAKSIAFITMKSNGCNVHVLGQNMLGEPTPTVLKRNRDIRSIPHHLCVGHRYMLTREPRRILNLRSSRSPILSIYELFCIGVRKSFCSTVKIALQQRQRFYFICILC